MSHYLFIYLFVHFLFVCIYDLLFGSPFCFCISLLSAMKQIDDIVDYCDAIFQNIRLALPFTTSPIHLQSVSMCSQHFIIAFKILFCNSWILVNNNNSIFIINWMICYLRVTWVWVLHSSLHLRYYIVSMCFISCLNDARYVCESGCLTACNQSPFMIGKWCNGTWPVGKVVDCYGEGVQTEWHRGGSPN